MKLPIETVMAYVDGELDATERAAVESAIAADAQVRAQVNEQRDLKARLQANFAAVLDEAVPDRLLKGLGRAPAAEPGAIADLGSARAAKQRKQGERRRWSLPQLGAIAASLVIGVLLGQRVLDSPEQGTFSNRDGQLLASGALADALTNQLASTQTGAGPARIGLSYRDEAGAFCRTFVVNGPEAASGIACRSGDTWRVDLLTRITEAEAAQYRTASSALPEAVRRAVESNIAGEPLDAAAESKARDRGWK